MKLASSRNEKEPKDYSAIGQDEKFICKTQNSSRINS